MIKIAICDDDKAFTDQIHSTLKELSCGCMINKFYNSKELLHQVQKERHYDIYVLDIEMPEFNGMDLAKAIREKSRSAIIIFLTGYSEYVFDSFELNTFRYIPKNEVEKRLIKAVNDAVNLIDTDDSYITIDNNYGVGLNKIFCKSIIYINKYRNDVLIHTAGEVYTYKKQTLQDVYDEIKSGRFVFVERGFIVNISCIEKLKEDTVVLINQEIIPVSRRYKKTLKSQILEYWSERV